MSYELIVGRKSDGKTINLTNCTTTASWETQRTGTPGTFKFTYLRTGDSKIEEGDIIRFSEDGELQFYGWVFTRSTDRYGVTDVTCYDRLRYLKANASYAFYDNSTEEIIKKIAEDLQVGVGTLSATGYKLPSLIEQDKSCIDIINEAVQQTLLNTGKVYIFFDDGDGLCLKESQSMVSPYVFGEGSLMTDYTYKTDIDSQTYNSVKLARPNEETGKSDVFIQQDSYNIGKWGLLQLYQTVDSSANDAQVKEQLSVTLEYYNQILKTFKFSALGVPSLRAGQMVLCNLSDLDGAKFQQYIMLEKVTHSWEGGSHTMEIEARSL